MRAVIIGFMTSAALFVAGDAAAEIFKCEDAQGGVVYQETPCPAPESDAAEDSADTAESEAPATPAEDGGPRRLARGESLEDSVAEIEESNRRRAEVEACKQQYRDAIDAIDLEIRNSYSAEQKEYYLGRLKALTDQMAAC